MEENKRLSYTIGGICLLLGLVVAQLVKKRVKDEADSKKCFMIILGLGLLIGAFLPLLVHNYHLKSRATDSILPIFLIFTIVGVLLRFPALRGQLAVARKNCDGVASTLLTCIAGVIPPAAHILWAWQCMLYDSDKAIQHKRILQVATPLLTLIGLYMSGWMLFVGPAQTCDKHTLPLPPPTTPP